MIFLIILVSALAFGFEELYGRRRGQPRPPRPILFHFGPGPRPPSDQRPRREKARVLLKWVLMILVGVGTFGAFLAHTRYADRTAQAIGWPTDTTFQTGVALAYLAVAILGVLCYFVRGRFWMVAVGAASAWGIANGAGLVVQLANAKDPTPNGAVQEWLIFHFGTPLVLIVLLLVSKPWEGQEADKAAQTRAS